MQPPPGERQGTGAPRLLAGILLLGALLRFVGLDRFPRLQADEGLWTTSTKNFLLFGDWFLDNRTHFLLSPLYHLASLPIFAVFGAHMTSARALSALAGIGTVYIIYRLALQLSTDHQIALVAAALAATNEWAVLLSRQALIESTETFLLSLSFLLALSGQRRGAVLGGLCFGLTLLTKSNAAALLPIGAMAAAAAGSPGEPLATRTRLGAAATFAIVAALVAGLGYAFLLAQWPDQFRSSFLFVLDGRDQVPDATPLVSVGRFGLEPRVIASSVLALFRESPFVFVLGVLGGVVAIVESFRKWWLPTAWATTWMAFTFLQLYQPNRYFFLAFPAIALLAALGLTTLARGLAPAHRVRGLVSMTVIAMMFETSYVLANAAKNREHRVAALREWSKDHLKPSETVLVASFLGLDLPARTLGHYYLVSAPDSLDATIRHHAIDYVIWDSTEWEPGYREILDQKYERVAEWDFGAVYRTGP